MYWNEHGARLENPFGGLENEHGTCFLSPLLCFVSFCFSLPVDIIVKETCHLCIDQYLCTWMIECIDMLPFGSLENEWDIIVKETCHLFIDKYLSTWMIEYIDMLPICSLENEYGALTCFLLVVWKTNTCFLLVVRKMNMEHGLFDWKKNPLLTLYCRIAIHTAADVSHCCIKTVTIHSSTINMSQIHTLVTCM
jgi:hypothetical protein